MTNVNPRCCPNLAEKISALVDDELIETIKNEVIVHLNVCDECSETYEVELFLKKKVYETNKDIQAPQNVLTWIREELLIINYTDTNSDD